MHVTIVGTGYVGLTTGVCLASLGHAVRCVDVVPERIDAINRGEPPFHEPKLESLLREAIAGRRLSATADLDEAVLGSEATFITVGTPRTAHGIDLSYVEKAARQIGSALRRQPRYHVVVVKSTVVPGTTASFVKAILEEASGRRAGEFGLCMNPEFLREGSAVDDFMHPDRIVIGQWDDRSGAVLDELYRSFACPKVVTTPSNAEMIKYASNALLATLISFSNEMAKLCEATSGTDVEKVLGAVHLDRRLSPLVGARVVSPDILSYLRAGCGFGGSCLPKDVEALRAYARQQGLAPHLLDAVLAVNDERPGQLVAFTREAVGALSGATVAVLGLAFKAGTDDLRDSPALGIIDGLLKEQASVKAYDPVVRGPTHALVDPRAVLCRTPEEAVRGADAALVVTAWPEFAKLQWGALCRTMRRPVVVDGRNALGHLTWPPHIVYVPIGRMPQPGNPQAQPG